MRKPHHFLLRAVAAIALAGLVWPVSAELTHRYSFTTDAKDSVGTAHGTAVQLSDANGPIGSAVTFTAGEAVLDGAGGYIDLPNGLLSTLTNVTVEAWVTWNGLGNWARIFDFGNSTTGETSPSQAIGTGLNYMFLTPNGAGSGRARFAITDSNNGGERPILNDAESFPVGEQAHIAVSYGGGLARMFVNGRLAASGALQVPLSALQDVNNWLGRSQWADPMFGGSYNEVRIHNTALSGLELKASSVAGPDTVSYDPGTINALSITVEGSMKVGATQIPTISANFSGIGDINVGVPDVTLTSSANAVVAITATGGLNAVGIGNATITASRGGKSATANIVVSPSAPATLKNRYSFNEAASATQVVDSVGGANGSTFSGASGTNNVGLGTGSAVFPSAANYIEGTYIDLPDGIVSTKTNITIETWVTWNGPANQNWQRIFDFGDSQKGADPHVTGNGLGYLFLTTRSGANPRFAARPNGTVAENPVLTAPSALPLNVEAHFVVVFAPQYRASRLYINGLLVSSGDAPFALTNLNDANNWLGIAGYNDPPFNGSINEFRIYEGVFTDLDVALSRNAGPNALAAAPGTLQTVSLNSIPSLLTGNPATTQTTFIGNFQNVTNVNITGAGAQFSSSDTNIFTVNATGAVLPRSAGSASLIAVLQGRSATGAVVVLPPVALRVDMTNTLSAGGVIVNATLRADFQGSTNVNANGFAGVTRSSANTNVATIAANGNVTAIAEGITTLTSTYGGMTVQTPVTVVLPPGYRRGDLIHRFSFNGQPGTTVVTDSVGTAHGELVGLNPSVNDFNGTGQLSLAGGAWDAANIAYVNLPNGLVSTLSNVTLEGWATWRGGPANQRFFDFGMSSGAPDGAGGFGEDVVASPGRSYMFLTPSGNTNPRFAIKQGTAGENPNITSTAALVQNTNSHFAVVYDPPNGVARLYINGRRMGTAAAAQPLSTVDDRNVWIGRSMWPDPILNGLFDEFRIYNGPLSDANIAASFAAGPNQLPDLTPVPNLSARIAGANVEIIWQASATGFVLEVANALGGTWTPVGGTPIADGSNVKITVTRGTGSAFFYRLRK